MNTTMMPSDRKFGWTFAAIFLLIGAVKYPWMIPLAGVIAIITLTRAEWLAPAKRAWMKLGELLNKVVSPVVMGLIFFVIFTPVGIVMRLAGRDALSMRLDKTLPTYWVRRDPPGPADDSFKEPY
ncbi:MAG TPA: SxtJ family membrane protein [Burkholderiales bacterium]|nr:SxtJ family membrane protein [Burkholderiales bacterium]